MPAIDVDVPDVETPHPFAGQQHAQRVRFYRRVIRDEEATEKAGAIRHKSVEFIKIGIPGDKTIEVDRPARPEDKRAYPDVYRAFVDDQDQAQVSGLYLKMWPGLPEELAEDFISMKVMTVEQLAAVTDGNIENLGPLARQYRQKAQEYLAASKAQAPVHKIQEQLEEERKTRKALEKRLAELEKLVGKDTP